MVTSLAAFLAKFLGFLSSSESDFQLTSADITSTITVTAPALTQMASGIIVHRVKSGDSFSSIAERYGVNPQSIIAANKAISDFSRSHKDLWVLRPGEAVRFNFSSDGEIEKIEVEVSKLGEVHFRLNAQRQFTADYIEYPLFHKERVAVGEIKKSFAEAAQKAGMSYSVVDDLVDLFSDRVSFQRDFRVGDRFSAIYREQTTGEGVDPVSVTILAAAMNVNGKKLVAVRYLGDDGKARYFNQDGKLIGDTFLRYPLKFSRISSTFSTARFHPILRRNKPHNGVDFAAPTGTPVRAVASGVVEMAGRNAGAGNMIKIKHNDRFSTAYMHLSRIMRGVTRGRRVERGQVIGAVGQTGLATGPHLHYSFFDRGKYVDPLKIELPGAEFLAAGQQVDRTYLGRVLFTLGHYQSLDLDEFIRE